MCLEVTRTDSPTLQVVKNAADEEACKEQKKKDSHLNYTWMYGDNTTGVCIAHLTTMSEASSPAFDPENSSSSHYSTWTESIWNQPEMSLFIQVCDISSESEI